jgi:hemolysin D
LNWVSFGRIDIVASAPGKIIPSGRTKVIQPFKTGVVRAIHVRDGQSVKAGQALIELDTTMNEAERNHLRSDLMLCRRSSMPRACAPRSAIAPIQSPSFIRRPAASPGRAIPFASDNETVVLNLAVSTMLPVQV